MAEFHGYDFWEDYLSTLTSPTSWVPDEYVPAHMQITRIKEQAAFFESKLGLSREEGLNIALWARMTAGDVNASGILGNEARDGCLVETVHGWDYCLPSNDPGDPNMHYLVVEMLSKSFNTKETARIRRYLNGVDPGSLGTYTAAQYLTVAKSLNHLKLSLPHALLLAERIQVLFELSSYRYGEVSATPNNIFLKATLSLCLDIYEECGLGATEGVRLESWIRGKGLALDKAFRWVEYWGLLRTPIGTLKQAA
jgi:hypothetical protein